MHTNDALEPAGPPEIESLNLLALDIEELETRLEMTQVLPHSDCWANACLIHG